MVVSKEEAMAVEADTRDQAGNENGRLREAGIIKMKKTIRRRSKGKEFLYSKF